MNDPATALLLNTAVLVALIAVLDVLLSAGHPWLPRRGRDLIAGASVGLLCILVIRSGVPIRPGVIFDARSVLMSLAGLFFGWKPALLAAGFAVTYRWTLGGDARVAGVSAIVATTVLGCVWRGVRRVPLERISAAELGALGVVSQFVVLSSFVWMPPTLRREVTASIWWPSVAIFPLATMALGLLLRDRLRQYQTFEQLRRAHEELSRAIRLQEAAHAERRAMEERVRQHEKLEALGRLAGGVAHDFNNQLQVILGYTEQVLSTLGAEDRLARDLREVLAAAERAAQMTRQLLAFARQQPVTPKQVDLNAEISGSLRMLRRLIGEQIEIIWEPGADLPPIWIDPVQVTQIVTNLCTNARDAIEGAGTIEMRTGTMAMAPPSKTGVQGQPMPYVWLEVRDNGRGMEEEVRRRAFEPLFTTKPGKGYGLGLSTVYGIVTQNGGWIDLDSSPGIGTRIRIYFPPASESVVQPTTAPEIEPPRPTERRRRILLVEDEESVRRTLRRMLEALGYEVHCAPGPRELLESGNSMPEDVSLLIADYLMPDMTGLELLRRLRRYLPNLRCLFVTGYGEGLIESLGECPHADWLEKPVTMDQLRTKIEKLMAS